MKWPWVSRAVVDEAEGQARELVGRSFALTQQLECERARYDALLEKYHALKVVGAAPEVIRAPIEAPEPDPVTQAILARSHGNARLYQHHVAFANRQRALGIDETNIALAIQIGMPDDAGVVGVGD